jgi:hypothetical protein
MAKTPIAGPKSTGRIFGTDWSIAHVATLLRANAKRGVWRNAGATGGYTGKINENYLRTVSARHLPTKVSLLFLKLQDENAWYASLCFAGADDYLPWNEETAELWLWALFDVDRPRIVAEPSAHPSVRQFSLPIAGA